MRGVYRRGQMEEHRHPPRKKLSRPSSSMACSSFEDYPSFWEPSSRLCVHSIVVFQVLLVCHSWGWRCTAESPNTLPSSISLQNSQSLGVLSSVWGVECTEREHLRVLISIKWQIVLFRVYQVGSISSELATAMAFVLQCGSCITFLGLFVEHPLSSISEFLSSVRSSLRSSSDFKNSLGISILNSSF